jgi:hypothetical protein
MEEATRCTTYEAGSPELYAYELGREHGTNAASWVDIADESSARRILAGLEDVGSEVLDALPCADLSGQWADSLTGTALVLDAMPSETFSDDERADAFSDICDAYELGFSDASTEAIETRARRMLTL